MVARAVLLLFACLLPASGPGVQGDEEKPSPQAMLLAKAEKLARDGRYAEAVAAYKQLAKRHGETPEGAVGTRRSTPSAYLGWAPIVENGPSRNRVDVALMGDGFQLGELDQFDDLAEDATKLFERQRTFREYHRYFNFQRLALVSKDNGVDGFGREYDTALNARTLGTIAGHVGIDGRAVHMMLDEKGEHDLLAIVFVKLGVLGTGGGGIACIGGRADKTVIHEWGHAFADLGDEYASKTHERGAPGSAANVSNTDDPKRVPWKHWIEAKVPGVGIYEGASGQVRGAWKPTSSGCVMEDGEFFCPPCQEALVLRIYSLVDPIDECSPVAHPHEHAASLELVDELVPLRFTVRAMEPATHALEARWWVLPDREAPPDARGLSERYRNRFSDRRQRGALPKIVAKPELESRFDRNGVHEFVLKKQDLEPGRYRVICRVNDTTEVRGERFPWVLMDEHELLVSERAWWVEVGAK